MWMVPYYISQSFRCIKQLSFMLMHKNPHTCEVLFMYYTYTQERKVNLQKKRKGNDDMREVPNDVAESIF